MATYDLYVQIVPADQYTGMKFLAFGQTRTIAVRGIQKLVGLFVFALLTPIGSDPLDLGRGTDLPNLPGTNVGVRDAQDILNIAVAKAVTDIIAAQTGKQIDIDERLSSATVTAFIEVDEAPGFAAQILIKNTANQSLQFLIPTLTVRS